MSRRSLRRNAGFSLIELVLVILLVSIAALPLLTQMTNTSVHAADGQSTTTAAFLARERLEEIYADRDSPTRGYAWIQTANYPAESPVAGFTGYARTTSISAESLYSSVTFREVTVTVTSPTSSPVSLAGWVVSD